ncbi:hypothetical protein VDGD_21360 [Verticillium dahliae]|nr:hypothetical protein VDGD_21360 [Verticillium dahliae]
MADARVPGVVRVEGSEAAAAGGVAVVVAAAARRAGLFVGAGGGAGVASAEPALDGGEGAAAA